MMFRNLSTHTRLLINHVKIENLPMQNQQIFPIFLINVRVFFVNHHLRKNIYGLYSAGTLLSTACIHT